MAINEEDKNGENQEEDKNQFKTEEDMSQEERDQLASDEDYILNFKQEDYSDPAKSEKLEKALTNAKTTIHQKRHYRTKYKAEVDAKATAQEKLDTEKQKELDKKENDGKTTNDFKATAVEIIDFRQDNPEVSKDVATEIIEYAKVKKMTTAEAMKKPFIKSLMKSTSTKEEIEDAGITPKQNVSGGKIAEKDWSTASQEEMEEARRKMGGEM